MGRKQGLACFLWASLALCGCSSDTSETQTPPGGQGGASAADGGGGAGGTGPLIEAGVGTDTGVGSDAAGVDGAAGPIDTLIATVRDFKAYDAKDPSTNPDFENPPSSGAPWDDKGIVEDKTDVNGKPVYVKKEGGTLTTHGKSAFDAWFRDVEGMNKRIEIALKFRKGANGVYTYDSDIDGTDTTAGGSPGKMFFPIDNKGFGNQSNPHNYHFTLEMHMKFQYKGGETFKFKGDDDVWVFINGKRVIDLGGIHPAEEAEVKLAELGLTTSQSYILDFFYAERHVTGSNLRIDTTIEFTEVVIR